MRTLSLLIATALAAGIVVFYDRNPEVVRIDMLLGTVSMALSVALLGAGFLGALAGGIFMAMMRRRTGKEGNGKEKNVRIQR
jgi:uncharacterized integral membrane protein